MSVDGNPSAAEVYIYDAVLKNVLVGRTTAAADGTWSFPAITTERLFFVLAVAADGRSCGFDSLRPV